MNRRPSGLLIALGAGLALSFTPGCRSLTRSIANTDMEGKAAPALTGTAWVLPAGEAAPARGEWMMLAFFKPW